MQQKLSACALLILLFLPWARLDAQGDDGRNAFQKAYSLYNQGNTSQAKELFQKTLESGYRLSDYSLYYLALIAFKESNWEQVAPVSYCSSSSAIRNRSGRHERLCSGQNSTKPRKNSPKPTRSCANCAPTNRYHGISPTRRVTCWRRILRPKATCNAPTTATRNCAATVPLHLGPAWRARIRVGCAISIPSSLP